MGKFAFNVPEVRILIDAADASDAWCKLEEVPGFHIDASLDDPSSPAFLIRGFRGEIDQLATCVVCGCTNDDACELGCSWLTANLCDTDDERHYVVALQQAVADLRQWKSAQEHEGKNRECAEQLEAQLREAR